METNIDYEKLLDSHRQQLSSITSYISDLIHEKRIHNERISEIDKEIDDKNKVLEGKKDELKKKKKILKPLENKRNTDSNCDINDETIKNLQQEIDILNKGIKTSVADIKDLKNEKEALENKLLNLVNNHLYEVVESKTKTAQLKFEEIVRSLSELSEENKKLSEKLQRKERELIDKENQRRVENVKNAETINRYDNLFRKVNKELKIEFEEFYASENDEMTIGLGNNLRLIINNIIDTLKEINFTGN